MISTAGTPELLGVGLYGAPQVARLVGISSSTVRRWLSGYQFRYSTRGGRRVGASERLIASDLAPIADRGAISFVELVETLVVSAFLRRGVPMSAVRRAAHRACQKLGTIHPFAYRKFKTDGKGIFLELVEESDKYRLLLELSRGQYAFPQILDRYLQQIDFDGETMMAIRWWPLGRHRPVVLDPTVAFGSPIIANTRVLVSSILEALRAGETRKSVSDWYGITPAEVSAGIAFYREKGAA